MCKKAHYMMEG